MTLPAFLSSKRGIKLMTFLLNFGKFSVVTGGVLWLNQVSGALHIVSGGGILIAVFYLLSVFIQPQERHDWSVVHPELGSVDYDTDKKQH